MRVGKIRGPISQRQTKRRRIIQRAFITGVFLPVLALGLIVIPVERANAAFPLYERSGVIGSQKTVKAGVSGTAVDSQGNIYASHDGGYIKKFDSAFNFITMWSTPYGAMSNISALTVDTSDNVWATDTDNHSVYKFSNTGTLLLHVGGGATGLAGSGNTQFNTPRDIVVDASGNFYVADTGYHRIKKFNSTGAFQWVTAGTTASSADGRFSTPNKLAINSTGNIYVADTGNDRIQVINPSTGAYVSKFGYTGGGLYCQTMTGIKGMTIDPVTDTIYVSVSAFLCDHIYRFDAAGTYLGRFADVGIRNYIRYNNGTLYSTDGSISYANTSYTPISKINATTGVVEASYGTGINNGDLRSNILAVTSDSAGNLYVADTNQRVTKFDADGNFVAIIADYGTTNPDDLRLVADMAVGNNDNLYVLDATRRTVLQFDASGAYVRAIGTTGTSDGQFNANPTGITVADDGSVFASTPTYVNKYASDGTYVSKITNFPSGTGFTNLSSIIQLLTDSQNNLKVFWSGGSRIATYSSAGAYVSGVTVNDLGDAGTADDFKTADTFALDSFDNLYAYHYGQQKVAIINSAGKIQTSWPMTDLMPTWPSKHPNGSITSFAGAFYVDPSTNRMFASHRYSDWLDVIEPVDLVTPPSAPLNVSAIASGNGLNVTWDTPTNSNNGPVRSYTIQYRPEDFGDWITSGTVTVPTTAYTIPELVSDSYEVRVMANNDAGSGATASSAATLVTARAAYIGRQAIGNESSDIWAAVTDKTTGELYVYDNYAYDPEAAEAVTVYDSSMNVVRKFGNWGAEVNEFRFASDMAFGPDNLLYVSMSQDDRISVFQKDGAFVRSFGVSGSGPGQLSSPGDLTFDNDGTLIITNEYGNVQRFSTDGTFIEALAPEAMTATSTVVDDDGNLYVSNATYDVDGGIYKYSPDGTFLMTIGSNGEDPGQFYEAYDLEISPAGELVFADTWNAQILFYSLSGTYIETIGQASWDAIDSVGEYMTLNSPYDIEFLQNGTMFALDSSDPSAIIKLQVTPGDGEQPDPVTAPTAPQNASRTINGQDIALSWSAPSSNGGGAITGYQVRHKPSSGSTWTIINLNATTFATTLTGLSAGSYDITIAAQNSAGLGVTASLTATITVTDPTPPESEPSPTPGPNQSPTTTPSSPSSSTKQENTSTNTQDETANETTAQPTTVQPGTVQVSQPNTQGSMTVTWKAPAGIDVKEYLIEYRPEGLVEWTRIKVVSGTAHEALISLPAGSYHIRVLAIPNDTQANAITLGIAKVSFPDASVAVDTVEDTASTKNATLLPLIIGGAIATALAFFFLILWLKKRKKYASPYQN